MNELGTIKHQLKRMWPVSGVSSDVFSQWNETDSLLGLGLSSGHHVWDFLPKWPRETIHCLIWMRGLTFYFTLLVSFLLTTTYLVKCILGECIGTITKVPDGAVLGGILIELEPLIYESALFLGRLGIVAALLVTTAQHEVVCHCFVFFMATHPPTPRTEDIQEWGFWTATFT